VCCAKTAKSSSRSRCIERMSQANLNRRIAQALQKLAGRELDPGRATRVFNEYDVSRGYGAYHAHCRAAFGASDKADDCALLRKGFEHLDVLSAQQAAAIANHLQSQHELSRIKHDSRDLQGWTVVDAEFVEATLRSLFSPAVHERVTGYFGSEYLVHWVSFTLTPQAVQQKSVSFNWHCDKGPSQHLKLIVYLNATDSHGGNTEFVELEQTQRATESGYPFGWSRARSNDLGQISRLIGEELRSESLKMAAGNGVLFQPARVMHRGVSPSKGERLAITLCLLPSPVPWQVAWTHGLASNLATDANWHAHADQLLARLSQNTP
jgi:hypothetical protein